MHEDNINDITTTKGLRTTFLLIEGCKVIKICLAQRYSAGLRAAWSVVRVPAGAGNFSLHHRIRTGSRAHPASYPMGTRGTFPGG
jgi:hypothetical protein